MFPHLQGSRCLPGGGGIIYGKDWKSQGEVGFLGNSLLKHRGKEDAELLPSQCLTPDAPVSWVTLQGGPVWKRSCLRSADGIMATGDSTKEKIFSFRWVRRKKARKEGTPLG